MIKHAGWPCFIALSAVALSGVVACSGPTVEPTLATDLTDAAAIGARIYAGNCIACHQQDGRGLAGVYPSLVGSPVLLGDTKTLTLWVIKGQRPPSMPPGRYPTAMLQFGWMKPADAAALFTYLRSHYGNSGSAVAADSVAKALRQ